VNTSIQNTIIKKAQAGKKQLVILIDPDKADEASLSRLCADAEKLQVDFFLIGGSLLTDGDLEQTIESIKQKSKLPCIIFPGSSNQVSAKADALLFLSLLSSRNAEMLIGQQVIAAPYVMRANIEAIGTAYLLIDSGTQTTASYMSNSTPIPANKAEIAASTALAGEYLGMKLIYLDAGSGAKNQVPPEMIAKVKSYTHQPLVVGGGIDSAQKLADAFQAGADVAVIGDAFEKNPSFASEIKDVLIHFND
jgi:putative glycerol-1-phosphate prenyltransferase